MPFGVMRTHEAYVSHSRVFLILESFSCLIKTLWKVEKCVRLSWPHPAAKSTKVIEWSHPLSCALSMRREKKFRIPINLSKNVCTIFAEVYGVSTFFFAPAQSLLVVGYIVYLVCSCHRGSLMREHIYVADSIQWQIFLLDFSMAPSPPHQH